MRPALSLCFPRGGTGDTKILVLLATALAVAGLLVGCSGDGGETQKGSEELTASTLKTEIIEETTAPRARTTEETTAREFSVGRSPMDEEDEGRFDAVVTVTRVVDGDTVCRSITASTTFFLRASEYAIMQPCCSKVSHTATRCQTMDRAVSARRDGEATSFEIVAKYATPKFAYGGAQGAVHPAKILSCWDEEKRALNIV